MYTNETVLHLVDLIYAAAYEPTAWTTVLEELQRVMGAAGADLSSYALDRPSVDFSHCVGLVNADFKREYLSTFVMDDPWLKRMASRGRGGFGAGTIGLGEAIVSTAELTRTTFHNEFGRRWGYTGGLTAVISGDGAGGSALNLCRREHQQFGDADGELMRALMPHLQRAVQVHHRLAQADAMSAASFASLELAGVAVLLLDAHGCVKHATTAGAELLRERDGLLESNGALRATQHVVDVALQEAIASAIHTAEGRGFGSGGRLTLPRRSGKRALQVVVSPASARASLFTETLIAAVVLVTDAERHVVAPEAVIAAALGLTPAEARLARALAEGLDIAAAAERLDTTAGSLRTRLKVIFTKTDTHRQADLVRVVSAIPP